jgi:hypothetical protein
MLTVLVVLFLKNLLFTVFVPGIVAATCRGDWAPPGLRMAPGRL